MYRLNIECTILREGDKLSHIIHEQSSPRDPACNVGGGSYNVGAIPSH